MEQPLCIVKRFQKKPALQVASDPDASVSSFCEGPHTPLRDQPILTTVDTLDFENILFSSDAGDGQAVDAWSPEVNAAFPPTPPRLHTALQDSLDSGSSGSWNLVRGCHKKDLESATGKGGHESKIAPQVCGAADKEAEQLTFS
ncbi:unnamed protein product [Symbiodinium natans]|uniref:Uncharacterized protein n=1 Tax=Symbiodinium natans TaxID=878477 RepID=A0A812JZP6_9DINO|nr:unnamed protein product [Symbiodinium natans]